MDHLGAGIASAADYIVFSRVKERFLIIASFALILRAVGICHRKLILDHECLLVVSICSLA